MSFFQIPICPRPSTPVWEAHGWGVVLLNDVYRSKVFGACVCVCVAERCLCHSGRFITISGSIHRQQQPIYSKQSNDSLFQMLTDFTLLLPTPPFFSPHLSSRPAGRKENVMSVGWGKAFSAWEWLEIHSKLIGNKDNVLLIFSPITLWWMFRCWVGMGAGGCWCSPDSLHLMKLPFLLPKQLWPDLCLLR